MKTIELFYNLHLQSTIFGRFFNAKYRQSSADREAVDIFVDPETFWKGPLTGTPCCQLRLVNLLTMKMCG